MSSNSEFKYEYLDDLPIGCVLLDQDNLITYANSKMTELTGISLKRLMGDKGWERLKKFAPELEIYFDKIKSGMGMKVFESDSDQRTIRFKFSKFDNGLYFLFIEDLSLEKALLQKYSTHKEIGKRDPLTGLLNRTGAREIFTDTVLRLETGYNCIFALGDLDYFKKINDTYGHESGDNVLISFSKLLSELDFFEAARIGGEEFFLISIPHQRECLSSDVRLKEIQAMCNEFSRMNFTHKEINFNATCSFGVVSILSDQLINLSQEDVMRKCDELLYQAKQEGRNKIIFKEIS